MKSLKTLLLLATIATAFGSAALHAEADAPTSLETRLAGATFKGIYIRAGTPYTLDFGRDGSLSDSAGRTGRWWVDDAGEYCREWKDGPMAGVETCMEVIFHLGKVAIYSGDDKVLEGEIIPAAD